MVSEKNLNDALNTLSKTSNGRHILSRLIDGPFVENLASAIVIIYMAENDRTINAIRLIEKIDEILDKEE